MRYHYIPIIWPLLTSSFLTLFLGIFAQIKRKHANGAVFFALSMFIVTLWSFTNALEKMAIELSVKLFWANVQYIAYCFSPVSLLFLCMEATGNNVRGKKKLLVWLSILPCITLLLVWTNQLHNLILYDIHMDYSGAFPVIGKKYRSWFYIHAIYSHGLNLCAVLELLKTVFTKKSVYRKQALLLFLGTCFIIAPNLIYISGISPLKHDITPAFFGPAGIIMLWSIYHNRMFELVPLARAVVIEAMDAGVVVMNIQDRVLDMNPAFKKITGITLSQFYLMPIEVVCKEIPELASIMKDSSISHAEFTITGKDTARVYEIVFFMLNDNKNNCIGRLAMIYDITEKKQVQQEFLKQQWRLAVFDERERMARDIHDNLGQVLGFINFQAQAIRQELVNERIDLVSDKLDRLIEAAQNTHTEIREYISSIRTSVNTERDFITSLKNDIIYFEHQTGLHVSLDLPEEPIERDYNSTVMVNIENIIREALNNISKHAQASEVRISFDRKENQIIVSIADDGKGFNAVKKDYTVKNKYGLDIMRERAALIGGKVNIESEPNKGSRITLYVPRTGGDDKNENESNAR